MPDLSEFVEFVAEKTGVKNRELIEKDILLHKILKEIVKRFNGDYLFKGGSCLVKCYYGYYRFSVDLDFTWANQNIWKGLGKKRLRKALIEKINEFGDFLESLSQELDLDFVNDLKNKKYFEFGGGSRMVTFKLWKNEELIKIQINFIEKILFEPRKKMAKTLLFGKYIKNDEKLYFSEFLRFYKPFKLMVYDEKEILCEKLRAILTRRKQKLQDFYDLFIIDPKLELTEKIKEEIIEKIKFALYYQKYKEALGTNKKNFFIEKEISEDPFERSMFIITPKKEFENFLKKSQHS